MQPDTNFSEAWREVLQGKRFGRRQWKNAKFVFLVAGSQFQVNRAPLNMIYPEGTQITYRPHVDMVGTDGSIGTWTPSMVDLLAADWYEVIGEFEDITPPGTGPESVVATSAA